VDGVVLAIATAMTAAEVLRTRSPGRERLGKKMEHSMEWG